MKLTVANLAAVPLEVFDTLVLEDVLFRLNFDANVVRFEPSKVILPNPLSVGIFQFGVM